MLIQSYPVLKYFLPNCKGDIFIWHFCNAETLSVTFIVTLSLSNLAQLPTSNKNIVRKCEEKKAEITPLMYIQVQGYGVGKGFARLPFSEPIQMVWDNP